MSQNSISFLIGGLDAGGSERQLLYLCRSFVNHRKLKPFVINWSGSESDFFYNDFINSEIEVLCLGGITNKIKRIFALRKALKKNSSIVIHSFSFYLNFIARICCIGTEIKAFGSLRSSYFLLKESSSMISRFINIYWGGKLVTNSYSAKKEIHHLLVFKYKSVSVLENHIPIPLKNKYYSSNYKIFNNNFQSLSVGRCDHNKRIDVIINIILKLKKAGISITHKHLGSGILLNDLISKVKELGIEENFQFLGRVDNVEEFMINSDFLIHTAETEGSPNVVIEAMSLGLVVITTNCGDLSWIIENEVDGVMVQNFDLEDAISNCIIKLMENERLRESIGKSAIERIKFNFDALNYSNKALDIYRINNDLVLFNTCPNELDDVQSRNMVNSSK